jgi:hypothetical protein
VVRGLFAPVAVRILFMPKEKMRELKVYKVQYMYYCVKFEGRAEDIERGSDEKRYSHTKAVKMQIFTNFHGLLWISYTGPNISGR